MAESLLFEYNKLSSNNIDSDVVYALLFDPRTNKAVKFSDGPPYEFADYNGNNQQFLIELTNDRVKHWMKLVDASDLSIPDVGLGEYYVIEIWMKNATGSFSASRTNDYLIETSPLEWKNTPIDFSTQLSEAYIDSVSATFGSVIKQISEKVSLLPDEPAAVRYECFCSISFDSAINRLGFCAWLEKDGVLQTEIQSATVTLTNSTNELVTQVSLTVNGDDGQKCGQSLTVEPSPDETYFMKVVIVDSNGNTHTSGASPVTWD